MLAYFFSIRFQGARVCLCVLLFRSGGHKTAKTTRPKWGSIQQSAISSEFHSVDLKQRHLFECLRAPSVRMSSGFFPRASPRQDVRSSGINSNHQSTSNPFLSLLYLDSVAVSGFLPGPIPSFRWESPQTNGHQQILAAQKRH